ncbi:MAG: alpha/beta-type small acid-soluble spore protein [Clostridia bacterium]|nr:alpha/beta-type small acid-soluble spore protein [Clostridia bacterium]MBQ2326762.1 alpha/beta-type small acid-soluble spore protein [Clostridia bacterium]MBQ2690576.1 alpha/beta-type small acid-soluble spore protein [Clostridia bacterium]MBQ3062734.1 alpha/beta-type small acid-soluble spore protein [Clostridia bacterium]MBQ5813602.1 alpha/beta-type small acid-soluble spore protein [Clostridia bacterium]
MASNSSGKSNLSPEAKNALHNFKMETAREVGINLKEGYNGDLTSKQAGSIGGQMVKKLIEKAEQSL